MEKILLTQKNSYLCLSEEEAYALVDDLRGEGLNIVDSAVKYKKMTKKKEEHYITTVTIQLDSADRYILIEPNDGE